MLPNFVDFVKSVTDRQRDRRKTVNDICLHIPCRYNN